MTAINLSDVLHAVCLVVVVKLLDETDPMDGEVRGVYGWLLQALKIPSLISLNHFVTCT